MALARAQAMKGLVAQGLMDSGVRLERTDAMEVAVQLSTLERRNTELDAAVVWLCRTMQEQGIRIWVFKGQTLAPFYPNPKARSCGDIDFLCHPDDWQLARDIFCTKLGRNISDTNSTKHVEFQLQGVQFEMHRMLTDFAYPKSQKYWDSVVMAQVLQSSETMPINGFPVPVLPSTINALYVFVHIFYHFIIDGIGLRQFCDWALVMQCQQDDINKDTLKQHLEGIGLLKAFTGFGAILTNYLGLSKEVFPFPITEKESKHATHLLNNILEKGNFGHNHHYFQSSGVIHGLEHLWEIGKQAYRFSHYAPKEAWWRIPKMFEWWGEKIKRNLLH